jgi:hypothetical protein
MGRFPLSLLVLLLSVSQRSIQGHRDPTFFRQTICLGANDHDQVHAVQERSTLATKPIANTPLDPIADYGVAHPAARTDAYAASVGAYPRRHQHDEFRACRSASFARNSIELS